MSNQNARVVGRLYTTPDGRIAQSQRTATRYPCRPDLALTILIRPLMVRMQVFLVDICANGLSFFCTELLPAGTILAMQRHVPAPTGPWVRSGLVGHCSAVEGGFLIGLEVTPYFSAEELDLLIDSTKLA